MLSSSASSLRLRSLPSSLRRWNAVRRLATQDAAPAEEDLQKTALYDMHKSLFADMVPFAGYWLPIMYKGDLSRTGILKEHLWCRAPGKASLFDVSHMGQVRCWNRSTGTAMRFFVHFLLISYSHSPSFFRFAFGAKIA